MLINPLYTVSRAGLLLELQINTLKEAEVGISKRAQSYMLQLVMAKLERCHNML